MSYLLVIWSVLLLVAMLARLVLTIIRKDLVPAWTQRPPFITCLGVVLLSGSLYFAIRAVQEFGTNPAFAVFCIAGAFAFLWQGWKVLTA